MIDQNLEACVNLVQKQNKEDILKNVLAGKCHILSGKSQEDKVQIYQWVEYAESMSSHKLTYAEEVNSYLASRTFIVGHSITAADVVMAAALQPFIKSLHITPETQWELCHLVRWFQLIQHLLNTSQISYFRKVLYL